MSVDGETISETGRGFLLLVGVAEGDVQNQADWLADKVAGLRVFEDADGKMNLSVRDVGGEVLCVSQFTLLADTKKGRRPSFIKAARPEAAKPLFDYFCERLESSGIAVKKGIFGAMMEVGLVNDGPVTIIIER